MPGFHRTGSEMTGQEDVRKLKFSQVSDGLETSLTFSRPESCGSGPSGAPPETGLRHGQGRDDGNLSLTFQTLSKLSELISRVSERTELGEFLVSVVAQLRIGDSRQFDPTVRLEDRLAALRETGRGEMVCESYAKCQDRTSRHSSYRFRSFRLLVAWFSVPMIERGFDVPFSGEEYSAGS